MGTAGSWAVPPSKNPTPFGRRRFRRSERCCVILYRGRAAHAADDLESLPFCSSARADHGIGGMVHGRGWSRTVTDLGICLLG